MTRALVIPVLVITISTDSIMLGGNMITRIADLSAGDEVLALREAIAGLAAERRATVAIQADLRTRGELLLRVVAAARRGGVSSLLFMGSGKPATGAPARPRASPPG